MVERPKFERLDDGTLETERVEVESPEVERLGAERLNVESDESTVFSVAEAVPVEPPGIELDDGEVVEGLDAGSAKLVPESFPHVFTVTNTVTGCFETTKVPIPNSKQIIEAESMISFLHTRIEQLTENLTVDKGRQHGSIRTLYNLYD